MDISAEYLNAAAIATGGRLRALAGADVLAGHFFALGLRWGASREEIFMAAALDDDDEPDAGEGKGKVGSLAASFARDSLLGATWGRA